MIQRTLLIAISIVILLASFGAAFAQPVTTQLDYSQLPIDPPEGDTPNARFADLARFLYQLFLGAGFIFAIGLTAWAGFVYITSLGNPSRVNRAKRTLTSALLGLGILFGSYTILASIDESLVVFNIQPLPKLELPSVEKNDPLEVPEKEACQLFPLQSIFEEIHRGEAASIEAAERVDIILGDENGLLEQADKIQEEALNCSCGSFTSICLSAGSGSAACPAVCEPGGEPCNPEFKNQIVPELENRLTRVDDIIGLLILVGLVQDTITEEELKILREEIIKELNERPIKDNVLSHKAAVESFLVYIESRFGDLGGLLFNRAASIAQLSDILELSLPIQLAIMENNSQKLTELRLDLDNNVLQVAEFRARARHDGSSVFTCAEALKGDIGGIADCRMLDLFWCP